MIRVQEYSPNFKIILSLCKFLRKWVGKMIEKFPNKAQIHLNQFHYKNPQKNWLIKVKGFCMNLMISPGTLLNFEGKLLTNPVSKIIKFTKKLKLSKK